MRHGSRICCVLLISLFAAGQSTPSMIPQEIEFPSGKLQLKGYLWKPAGAGPFPAVLFNHGSGGADADHTAGMPITQAANSLAPFFVTHGYAFLYPFRRGHGPSASQAPFMQDVLRREEESKGKDARQRLQFVLLTTEQLDDVMAALAFLKTVPGIDSRRIAIAGHSFGGNLTLLAAERDKTVRAAVTFAAAANSWDRSPELQQRLTTAIRNTNAAVMLTHAENDFSTSPGKALAAELQRLHKPYVLKIYPPVGLTSEDGHGMLYENIPAWESDVFEFLDQHVKKY
ncbi:MAG TPA: dienelactone hydrolase family protein [Terriglobales bacterium]|nr:dienelactone hydrolase family protein [Terriglobales bacterium]